MSEVLGLSDLGEIKARVDHRMDVVIEKMRKRSKDFTDSMGAIVAIYDIRQADIDFINHRGMLLNNAIKELAETQVELNDIYNRILDKVME